MSTCYYIEGLAYCLYYLGFTVKRKELIDERKKPSKNHVVSRFSAKEVKIQVLLLSIFLLFLLRLQIIKRAYTHKRSINMSKVCEVVSLNISENQ